jgi:signal transduction histidine kinase
MPSPTRARRGVLAWWNGIDLARKLDIVIVVVLLPTLIATAWLAAVANDVSRKTEVAAAYRNTAFAVYDLKVAMLNMETGYRGYALSGSRQFLEPFEQGRVDARVARARLRELNTFPREVEALIADTVAFETWATSSVQRVTAGRSLPLDLQRTLFTEGKRRFDTLRTGFDGLKQQSLDGFNGVRLDIVGGIGVLQALPWAAFALIVLGALVVRLGLHRLILLPLRKLEGATQRLGDGEPRVDLVVNTDDEIGRLNQTFNRTSALLDQRTREWQRSNRDLEQFAYVASHDLQEPLRMVSSYAQLLQKRYQGKLDERADTYIHYAVDGANRMQALIQDLLRYSRAGSRQAPLVPVDAGTVVAEVLNSLELAVQEVGADIQIGALPTVLADRVQLSQVFQNLIGNALKFRREGVQHTVRVSAEREGALWRFAVADNGIGIAPEYFERIFVIFQRLHTREQFAGSGIGLAICQRIVERHGGRIWVTSTPDIGTTFYFTLHAAEGEST